MKKVDHKFKRQQKEFIFLSANKKKLLVSVNVQR